MPPSPQGLRPSLPRAQCCPNPRVSAASPSASLCSVSALPPDVWQQISCCLQSPVVLCLSKSIGAAVQPVWLSLRSWCPATTPLPADVQTAHLRVPFWRIGTGLR